jgi:Na+/proline symporter
MEILAVLILAMMVAVCLVAFFLVLQVFFSRRIERTRQIAENTPGRAFLVGLVNFVFFAAIALFFFAAGNGDPVAGVIGLICLAPPAIGMLFGLAAVTNIVSERIAPQSTGIWRTAWGVLAVALACALPVAGWFGMLPFAGLLGLGAFILSLFSRKHQPSAANAPIATKPDAEIVPPQV